MTRDWDAATYDRIADPMARWGSAVLDRLRLRPGDRVLDAGCGSGRVTEQLLDRLPGGHVIALDGSVRMIDEARRRLAPHASRVSFVAADLARALPFAPILDAILSTATFHWIADHESLFRNLASALRAGGTLVAQCGGSGNIAAVQRSLARLGDGWLGPWTFATPDETRARLERAGFVEVETWLTLEPVRLEAGEPLETYLATVILVEHLPRLPEADRRPFVKAVAAGLPGPEIDYVRLNIVARRR